jgi:hypothetical protein
MRVPAPVDPDAGRALHREHHLSWALAGRVHHGTVLVIQKANESVWEGTTHERNIERPVSIRSARSAVVRDERGLLLPPAGRARAHPIGRGDSALLRHRPLRRVSGEPAVDAGQQSGAGVRTHRPSPHATVAVREEAMARTILVPLDATSESAAVLDTVRELARVEGATVRLLHVAPAPEAVVNDEGQVIAYADQETDRVEHEVTVFLKGLL